MTCAIARLLAAIATQRIAPSASGRRPAVAHAPHVGAEADAGQGDDDRAQATRLQTASARRPESHRASARRPRRRTTARTTERCFAMESRARRASASPTVSMRKSSTIGTISSVRVSLTTTAGVAGLGAVRERRRHDRRRVVDGGAGPQSERRLRQRECVTERREHQHRDDVEEEDRSERVGDVGGIDVDHARQRRDRRTAADRRSDARASAANRDRVRARGRTRTPTRAR